MVAVEATLAAQTTTERIDRGLKDYPRLRKIVVCGSRSNATIPSGRC